MNEAPFEPGDAPTMKEFIELKEQVFKTDEKVTRIAAAAARLEGDIFEIKRDVSELKGLGGKFDRFQAVLDGMTRQMESFERWFRFQGNMLVEHEGRLSKLEPKPQ
ncbi:MAG: hypothetical protein HYV14_13445 [Elusimicrobia bacterium]|jgi:hypothetical protein|nr:hypothetical protein [Elusimicrobiota bacterium]